MLKAGVVKVWSRGGGVVGCYSESYADNYQECLSENHRVLDIIKA